MVIDLLGLLYSTRYITRLKAAKRRLMERVKGVIKP